MNSDVLQVQNSLGIIGRSAALQKAIQEAILLAPYDANVLITGENGVGKEVFHKIIHNYSKRRTKKLFAVNCGALPDGTINSELFGHVKGAFTGAVTDRKGFFEEANEGTLFLDEVGELPLETQARLLRVLQNGEYIRVGSNEVRKTNVRVVAATNKNLLKAIEEGKFREDLYYRLATFKISIPPLRQRPEDIELLFRKFANDIADLYRMPAITLDESGRRALLACQWPGNIRQLESLVLQLSVLREERVMTADILREYLPHTEARMTISSKTESHDNDFAPGEKNYLYGAIFDMRRQIEELQAKVGITPSQPGMPGTALAMPVSHMQDVGPVANTMDDWEEQEAEEVHENEETTDKAVPLGGTLTKKERERRELLEALIRNGYNKRKTAEELDISERTVHRKVKEYGLEED